MNSEETENLDNPENIEPNTEEESKSENVDIQPTEDNSESKEAEEVKESENNTIENENIENNNINEYKERDETKDAEEAKTEEAEGDNEDNEREEVQPKTEEGENQNIEESKEEAAVESESKENEQSEEQPIEQPPIEESKEEPIENPEKTKEEPLPAEEGVTEESKEEQPTEQPETEETPAVEAEESKEEVITEQPVEETKEEPVEEQPAAEETQQQVEESKEESKEEMPVEEPPSEVQESKEDQILVEVPSAAPMESKEGDLVTTVAVDLPTNIQQEEEEEQQPEGAEYDDTVAPTKEAEELIYLQQPSEDDNEEEANEETFQEQTQPYDMNNNDYIDSNYEEDEYNISNNSDEQECVSLSFIHDPKMKSQIVATYLFPINIKFSIIHRKVDEEFKMLEGSKLVYNSITVTDDLSPIDLGMELRRQYIIEVKGDRKPPSPIILSNGNYTLKVQIKDCGEIVKAIDVEVTPCTIRKPFIGGFRKKKSGLEYHDACTNTPRMKTDWANQPSKSHRETQTYEFKTRSIQSKREHGTQMERKDLYIDNHEDKIIVPGPYFTAQQLEELKFEKTIVIQRYWRKFIACRRAKELRAERDRINKERDENIQKEDDGAEQKRHREIERRMHPRTTEDFEILYNELENWRYYENKRIKESSLGDKERLEALAQVLYKETQLLQNIDRLKCQAAKENKEENTNRMLDLMSNDKKWAMGDNEIATIETPYTKRASELKELYVGLCDNKKSIDERLDILLHIKWTIKEFDTKLTRELVELIDREADMLNRGRLGRNLEGLRTRIKHLFLTFIQTPEFNPEASRFQRIPIEFLDRPMIKPIPPSRYKAKTMTAEQIQQYQPLEI